MTMSILSTPTTSSGETPIYMNLPQFERHVCAIAHYAVHARTRVVGVYDFNHLWAPIRDSEVVEPHAFRAQEKEKYLGNSPGSRAHVA